MSIAGQDTSAWYAATKLHPPLVRFDTIKRPQLEKMLCQSIYSHPLTLVSAPAGYGKTTLLATLPKLLPNHPLVWVTLDSEDNDPIRFIGLLAASLQQLEPYCGRLIWPLISGGEMTEAGMTHAINMLLNDLPYCLAEPIIMVLDDLHFVTEPLVHFALDYLLEKIPPNLHMVLSTRYDPPLRLSRLAVRRLLGELRRGDLSFSIDESNQLLNDTLELSLSSAEVDALQAGTEGWPGILCLLSGPLRRLNSPENRTRLLEGIANSDRQVMDFLAEEILLELPADVHLFLLQTSILADMTPTACLAVTGREDAAQVLEGLYKHNLTIASLKTDATGEPVYRYHALFVRLLTLRMERELSKEEIIDLHRKAALVQTTPGRAIAHYFCAGQWSAAAELMVKSGTELLYLGMAETVRQWYGGIPAQMRSSYTHLNILIARCEIHRGGYAAARRLLEQAKDIFISEGDGDGEGDALTSLITISYHNNDPKAAASYIQRAMKLPLRPMGQVATRLGQAWLNMLEGKWEDACINIREGLAIPSATGDRRADLVGITYMTAPMIILPGCLRAAEDYFDQVVTLARPDTGWSLGAQELGTWPLLLQGKTEEALRRAEAAADLRQHLGGFPFVGNDLPLLLFILHMSSSNIEAAGQMADKLVEHTQKDGLSSKGNGMFYLHAAGRALAMLGRYDEAILMLRRLEALDSSYPLTVYLQNHLQGLIALARGHEADAAASLNKAVELEKRLPMARVGGSAILLQARLLLNQGKPDSAFALAQPLVSEWVLASTPGYALLDGALILPVLKHLAVRNEAGAALMLQLFCIADEANPGKDINSALTGGLSQHLTPREREVLKLLVAGCSNFQISTELYISNETVKSHVAHLLRKLDVSSRAQAAVRAQELGF